jgi:hypothetical protein
VSHRRQLFFDAGMINGDCSFNSRSGLSFSNAVALC